MTAAQVASLPQAAWALAAAVFGLVFGSFITALSYRVPRGQSIAAGRSKCPACGTTLTARDLVPVLSWLWNRGRCRACGVRVSGRYPAIEALTAAIFALVAWRIEDPATLALLLALAVVMITLAVIDVETARLPLPLLGIAGVLCLVLRWHTDPAGVGKGAAAALAVALLGLIIAAATRAWRGTPALGAGDAYSLALGAAAFPWSVFPVFLGLAGVLALLESLILRLAGRRAWTLPFAPAVFTAFALTALWAGDLSRLVTSLP